MVDFFLLLMLAGAGDELQGIKRGIIEMADAIFINKADGDNIVKANLAKAEYSNALHLFPPPESGWIPVVETCSALARLERAGELRTHDADVAIRDVGEMPMSLVGHSPLHTRAWALRGSLRLADAFYVACAELLTATLLTSDGRLARAPLSGVAVTLVR